MNAHDRMVEAQEKFTVLEHRYRHLDNHCKKLNERVEALTKTANGQGWSWYQEHLAADRKAAQERTQALVDTLTWIAEHPDGDDEPGEQNARRGGWEMSQHARKALALLDVSPTESTEVAR